MDGFMCMNVTSNIDFTEIMKKYPLQDTIIGFYDYDRSFKADNYEQIANIEDWDYAPLTWGESVIPFICFNGEDYGCWYFGYDKVCGYYYDGKNYGLVTFNTDFGTEITFPDKETDEYHIIIVPDEKNITKRIAKTFNLEAYNEGKIFTTYDELKNFVRNREKNS